MLACLDYAALAQALGVGYQRIATNCELEPCIQGALAAPGPVLTQVVTHYGKRPIRWIDAVKHRYTKELTFEQKVRVASRLGVRALDLRKEND